MFRVLLADGAALLTCGGYSPPAQPSTSSDSLTAGSVLLIVFFCLLAVYVLGGMVWNYRAGATGTDLLPHASFWKSVPGLIKDGVRFTVSCGGRAGSGGYQQVN